MGANSINNNNRPRLGNIINRVFESAGPDGKVRGTPQQIIDKYQALARDAQLAGDRVAAESFLQHSEHYSRMLGEAQAQQNEARQSFDRDDGPREETRRDDGRRDEGRRDDARRDEPRRDEMRRDDGPRIDAFEPQRPQAPRQPSIASGLAMIDPAEGDDFVGLIDTPESGSGSIPAPAAAPEQEQPPARPVAANGVHHASEAPAEAAPAPDAAPAKRSRTRRKARPEGEAAPAVAAAEAPQPE